MLAPDSLMKLSLEEGDDPISLVTIIELLNLAMAPGEPIGGYLGEPLERGTESHIGALDSRQDLLNDLIVNCLFPWQSEPHSFIDVASNFIDNADRERSDISNRIPYRHEPIP